MLEDAQTCKLKYSATRSHHTKFKCIYASMMGRIDAIVFKKSRRVPNTKLFIIMCHVLERNWKLFQVGRTNTYLSYSEYE